MTDTPPSQIEETGSNAAAVSLSVEIVSAYVSRNSIPTADLPALILNVYRAVVGLKNADALSASFPKQADDIQKPTAAQIRKSITPDGIVSFLDSKPYKTMKRHLGKHGLDPHSYRQRYGLPSDYPMVAPEYAARRSELAKSIGLGRAGSFPTSVEDAGAKTEARKPRARKAA